jgi:DNA repair protein RecO (recombination protein O)
MAEELSLILRASRYQDASKIVTFFSREGGLRTGFARGATARDNRFGASLEPVTLCRIVGRGGGPRSLYRIHHASILDPYRRIHTDYNRLSWAGLLVRFLLGVLPPDHPEPPLFSLASEALSLIEGERDPPAQTWLSFAREGLSLLGYRPASPVCARCHRIPSGERIHFRPSDGTVLCRGCLGGEGKAGLETSSDILEWLSGGEEGFGLSGGRVAEAMAVVDRLIGEHVNGWIPVASVPFLPDERR